MFFWQLVAKIHIELSFSLLFPFILFYFIFLHKLPQINNDNTYCLHFNSYYQTTSWSIVSAVVNHGSY